MRKGERTKRELASIGQNGDKATKPLIIESCTVLGSISNEKK